MTDTLPGASGLSSPAPRRRQAPLARFALCLALALALAARPAQAGGELVFGMSAAFSGPARGLGLEYCRGLMAAFEHTNAQGGAGGWRLKLSLRDDGYDPVPAMANTIAFMEDEQVFGLCGYVGTSTTARILPLLKRYETTDMTLFFPLTGAGILREDPYTAFVFTLRPSYLDETRRLVEALVAAGKRRIAVFHQADTYGRNGWDGVRRALRSHGLSMVSEAAYRRGAAYAQDFRREAELIRSGNPDAIITVGTAPACAAFVRDARNSGQEALIAALSFADADNLVKFLQAQGRVSGRDYTRGLVFSQVVPNYEDVSLPAVRLYRQVMDQARAAPPAGLTREEYLPHRYSFVSFEGFLAGLVLAEAVSRMGDAPARARLRSALAGLRNLDIGINERVSFGPGRNQGLKRTYRTVYRQGRFESVGDLAGVGP